MGKKNIIKILPVSIFCLFICLMIYINHRGQGDCCPEFYRVYKLHYKGVVEKIWINKGTYLKVIWDDKSEVLYDGEAPQLFGSAEIGDTIIKKSKSLLCTLKKKNNTYIFPYYEMYEGCKPCPDTNKVDGMK